MGFIRKIKAALVQEDFADYIGEESYLFYDITTGELRQYDGTPGGAPISGIGATTDETILPYINGATYTKLQSQLDFFHSTGAIGGGVITDNGDGTIHVTAGHGFIRLADDPESTLYTVSWAASNLGPFDNQRLYYIEVIVSPKNPTTGVVSLISIPDARPNNNEYIHLGQIMRENGLIHFFNETKFQVGDHARYMIERLEETQPFQHASGAILGETGTRNISITNGIFWQGLTRINTVGFDTSVSGVFEYYYRDGSGGWTEVTGQTQINNTQYDDGTGTLASLTPSNYGVHWIYQAADKHGVAYNEVFVLFGQGDYTLQQAQDSQPDGAPDWVIFHTTLIGKIIIQQGASTFTAVQSAFASTISPTAVTDHNNLLNKGTYTHAQIDTHMDNTANPHSTSIINLTDTYGSMVPADGDSLFYDFTNSRWDAKSLYVVGAKRTVQEVVGTIGKFSGTTDLLYGSTAPLIANGTQIVSQSFTPAYSSSQILVNLNFTWSVTNSGTPLSVAIFRDSTCVGATTASLANNNGITTFSYEFIDSGAFTPDVAVTYTIRAGRSITGSSTWYINQSSAWPTLWADLPLQSDYTIKEVIVR